MTTRHDTIKAVDLFCGAGGSAIGARQAGVEIVGSIDADPVATATFADNFPAAKVVNGRLDAWNGPSQFGAIGTVDLLLASPECTNHSVARGAREIDKESLRSAAYIMPFIEEWEPAFVILENVTRIKRWEGWTDLLKYLQGAGYHLSTQELDAVNFGVPQSRRRMFILCSLEGPPSRPQPVRQASRPTARSILDPTGVHRVTSIHDRRRPLAQGTLERIARGRSFIPNDDFLIVYYGSDAAGGWQSLDRPIRTLTTLDRFGLVSGTGPETTLRMLQVTELRRAMGLPDDFRLNFGSRRDRIRLLGNGVCPPVMAAVIRAVLRSDQSDDGLFNMPYQNELDLRAMASSAA